MKIPYTEDSNSLLYAENKTPIEAQGSDYIEHISLDTHGKAIITRRKALPPKTNVQLAITKPSPSSLLASGRPES